MGLWGAECVRKNKKAFNKSQLMFGKYILWKYRKFNAPL